MSTATQAFRPPNFSEDAAWLPCWLQNIRTDGSEEFVKESQDPSIQTVKDLAPSQQNGNEGNKLIHLSREEGRYKTCHLFLSEDDTSPASVAQSPGIAFHFSLRLSSDVESLFCPTQDLNDSHDTVTPKTALSFQLGQTSVDLREKMHSVVDYRACEPDLSTAIVPETVIKDASKSVIDTTDSVRQQNEESEFKCFKSDDISDAVELSIAASEALVIHDLVKMGSDSETKFTEAVLEIALRVKQARLHGLQDGFQSLSEESDISDSLSDLNDFLMEDAYKDIGLPVGISFEENLCNSPVFQGKGVPMDDNTNGCNNTHSDREPTSQLAKFNDKSEQKQLEVNMEMEMQQNTDSPQHHLFCEKEMPSNDPDLVAETHKVLENDFPRSHEYIENNTNGLDLNQTVGLATVDSTSIKPRNSVNSSFVETSGNLKKENWATYLAPERFRSRWLGGWTCKELDSSSINRYNAERVSKLIVRETSFLSESVDTVPDESSFVLKHDPKCVIGSQLSIPSEGLHNKPDESVLHSQDAVRCSSQSLIDPLCSVVPCSISSEHDNHKSDINHENNAEDHVPSISEFEVDNFQRISNMNGTSKCGDEKQNSALHGKDIPITATEMVEQMTGKLRIEKTCLKTYSMIIPNEAFNLNCNLKPLPNNQTMCGPVSLGMRISESPPSPMLANENENEEILRLTDHRSITEITDEKQGDEFKLKAADANDILAGPTQERVSPRILNHRTLRRLQAPKTVGNDMGVEKNVKRDVVTGTVVQHQQNDNLHKPQVECGKFHGERVRVGKQVHFAEKVEELHPKRKLTKLESSHKKSSSVGAKRQRVSKSSTTYVPRMKRSLTNYCRSVVSELIFQGVEFLLTGLSSQKEKDMEALIRSSGGVVLYDIPSPPNSRGKRSSTLSRLQLPIILCMKKLQTTKFLYGCAVGASIVKVDWLTDCVSSGIILQPDKYMILPNRNDMKWTRTEMAVHHRNRRHIFESVGIMLYGKRSFCTKLATIVKHGGGRVFKTLHWLLRSTGEERTMVGAIVVEDKATLSRQLKSCALERDIPVMPSSWIIKSLYSGKLLPFKEENNSFSLPCVEVPKAPISVDMSQEI